MRTNQSLPLFVKKRIKQAKQKQDAALTTQNEPNVQRSRHNKNPLEHSSLNNAISNQAPKFEYHYKNGVFTLMTKALPKGRPRLSVNTQLLREAVSAGNFKKALRAFSVTTPQKTLNYERDLRYIFSSLMERHSLHAIEGDVAILIELHHTNRIFGDVDNQAKAILDAMNERLFTDDKKVADLHIRRYSNASVDFFKIRVSKMLDVEPELD